MFTTCWVLNSEFTTLNLLLVAAALEHSEFTYERRKENREREAAENDEKEERRYSKSLFEYKSTNTDAEAGSRPERLWKAVKDGKSKTITEILEKPFVRTAPAVPLVKLTDDAGSVFARGPRTPIYLLSWYKSTNTVLTLARRAGRLAPLHCAALSRSLTRSPLSLSLSLSHAILTRLRFNSLTLMVQKYKY